MTPATASADAGLAGLVRLVRAAAGLIEQAGIPGLALFPHQDEIVIQIPSAAGDAATRAARVARLAALAGCEPAPRSQQRHKAPPLQQRSLQAPSMQCSSPFSHDVVSCTNRERSVHQQVSFQAKASSCRDRV